MRNFQKAAMKAIGAMLRGWGVDPKWIETSVGPFSAMNYGPDDVDVHAGFSISGSHGEIWIHPDDLSATLFDRSPSVESQDHPGDSEAQIRAFCQRLQEIHDANDH